MSEDVRGILSNLSGLPKSEVDRLWGEVKANSATLNACPQHLFPEGKVRMGDKLTCVHCKGTVSLTDAGWYVKGFAAAGGDPDAVWPGFKKKASP